jgi:uncharacterized protein YdhG (YjbR/CyaY superfamily)
MNGLVSLLECDFRITENKHKWYTINKELKKIIVLEGAAMEGNKVSINSIDDYISQFPTEIQIILEEVRKVIKESASEAREKISYQMPTFEFHGNLVHFAAYKNHIGFYPTPSGIGAFKEELSKYKGAKGSVQFPLDKPIPYDLISEIVKFRVAENIKKAKAKLKKK